MAAVEPNKSGGAGGVDRVKNHKGGGGRMADGSGGGFFLSLYFIVPTDSEGRPAFL